MGCVCCKGAHCTIFQAGLVVCKMPRVDVLDLHTFADLHFLLVWTLDVLENHTVSIFYMHNKHY